MNDNTGGKSLSGQVYEALYTEIIHCTLAPGEVLDAAAIARRYDVSKTPVRDAMQRLAREGLVNVLPRSGYRVAPITFQAVHEILDLRAAIAPHAARKAAELATPEEIAGLREILKAYEQPLDGRSMPALARRFHLAVARCSRNQRLVRLSEGIFDELDRLLRFAVDFSVQSGTYSGEHHELVDAIETRNGDRAALIEAEHIGHIRKFLIERLILQGLLSGTEIRQPETLPGAGE